MLFLATVLLSPVTVFSEERCLLQRGAIRAVKGADDEEESTEAPTAPRAPTQACFESNQEYSPTNMAGQGRSVEDTARACQQRCASVSDCAHFSIWLDGGCHLQDGSAQSKWSSGVTAGPPTCQAATSVLSSLTPKWITTSSANLFCKDTESYAGWSTGSEDCKAKCSSDSSCNFYSIWKTNFCRLTASCSDKGPDGDHEILIYSKPQKESQTIDISAIGEGAGVQVKEDDSGVEVTEWTATRWNRNGDNCSPMCSYRCSDEQPTCKQDCEPVCKQPKCTTDCEDVQDLEYLKQCKTVCGKPECKVVCNGGCPDGKCPECTTSCTNPTCTTECPEKTCSSKCDPPACEWKCNAPAHCPPPDCKFWCETPEKCTEPTVSLAQIYQQISLNQTSVRHDTTGSKMSSSKMSFLQLPATARVPILVRTVFEAWSQPVTKSP